MGCKNIDKSFMCVGLIKDENEARVIGSKEFYLSLINNLFSMSGSSKEIKPMMHNHFCEGQDVEV